MTILILKKVFRTEIGKVTRFNYIKYSVNRQQQQNQAILQTS